MCSTTTALTDGFDIVASKALRKVEVGEILEQMEEPKDDPNRSLKRVRIKAKSDGAEGWVTMKGNKGTEIISQATSHRECRCKTSLRAAVSSNSKVLRTLEENEIFEILEGPKTEKKEGAILVKGLALSNGMEGWFSTAGSCCVEWSPVYKCDRSTDLKDGVQDDAQVVRPLKQNELLFALQQPSRSEKGVLHVQVQAESDAAIGFAVVKGPGKVFLIKPVLRET